MAELRQVRVKVFVTDGVPLKTVKDRLRAMIRQGGKEAIGEAAKGDDLLDAPTIYWDAAEIYQGAETAVRRKKDTTT
ncbi:MAG: hypothetical protein KGL35_32830 [Bradyrhizobium sp.]|nr:hypothetical protein [Bradyrhizobium sp.]